MEVPSVPSLSLLGEGARKHKNRPSLTTTSHPFPFLRPSARQAPITFL